MHQAERQCRVAVRGGRGGGGGWGAGGVVTPYAMSGAALQGLVESMSSRRGGWFCNSWRRVPCRADCASKPGGRERGRRVGGGTSGRRPSRLAAQRAGRAALRMGRFGCAE